MDDVAAACNAKLPEGIVVKRVVAIDDRAPKLAVDIVAVALDVALESDDAVAAGAPSLKNGGGAGADVAAISSAISNRFLNTPSAAAGETRVLDVEVAQTEGTIHIRYTSTMDNGRIVTPDSLVAAVIGDPASFRVPLKVMRRAQFVVRNERHVSPIDEGVVHTSS